MQVSAWVDIIGLMFILSISYVCFREGILWPLLLLLGSTLAHSFATNPRFQEKVSTVFPALEEAVPSHYTIPVLIFVITLFASHCIARYIAVKLDHSSLSLFGTINRVFGGMLGVVLAITIMAWGYHSLAYRFPELAVYCENSSVCRFCVEQEERFNFGEKIVGILKGEAKKAKDVIKQKEDVIEQKENEE